MPMEGEAFAQKFTAAMDSQAGALARRLRGNWIVRGIVISWTLPPGSPVIMRALSLPVMRIFAPVFWKGSPVDGITWHSIAARGFSGRVDVVVGDMFSDPFPPDCDLHLFSNVLHDWDEDKVRLLLAKSFAALPVGGMVIIHDALHKRR